MGKEAKNKKNKILFYISIIVVFLLVSFSVYFIGKKLNNPSKKLPPVSLSQNQEFQYLIDFESFNYINSNAVLSKERALSGKNSSLADKNNPYSPAIIIPIPTNDSTEIADVKIKLWINPSSSVINSILVFSIIDQNNNQVYWDGFNIMGDEFQENNWYSFFNKFVLPDKFVNTGYSIKVYLWNKDESGSPLYIDDICISFKDTEIQEGPRTKLIDFENLNSKKISSKYAKSGFYSTYAKGKDDFSESILFPMSELDISNIHSISFSFNYLSETKDLDAVFVISICDSLHKDLLWQGVDLSKASFNEKTWETANGSVIIPPEIATKENFIKIYLWNRNANQVFVDDVYIVIKENNISNDTVLPAFNLVKERKYQAKANHPPYDVKYVYCKPFQKENANSLNKIFTKNSRILVDKFDSSLAKDQIFFNFSNEYGIALFENSNIVIKEIGFNTAPDNNAVFYSNAGYLFSTVLNGENINMYKYDKIKGKFILFRQVGYKNNGKISSIFYNPDNSVSVFENDGTITTFDDKSVKISSTKFINTQNGNSKAIKAEFFGETEEILIIYNENNLTKYIFLSYNKQTKTWEKSSNHKNSSVQSYDKLDFVSEYFVIKDDNSKQNKLLQFNRNSRFDLRVIGFDLMTYNILYNVDFRAYANKQNPKYYEYSKIVCGDFYGDSKSEIVIFQDNINRVDWLTQKTEIYSFNE